MRALAWIIVVAAAPLAAGAEACRPHVEVHPSGTSVSFRPHTSAFLQCTVDEATYTRVLGEWLGTAPRDVTSVALGRGIQYPWLAQLMREWDGGRQPTPAMLRALAAPFEGTGYEVTGVSFEKVLRDPDKVPFDAQVWLRVRARR